MIVPFETSKANRIPDIRDSIDFFESAIRAEIPVFVVENVDPLSELRYILSPLCGLIENHGLSLNPVGAEFLRDGPGGNQDVPLHIDGEQGKHVDLSLHRTLSGSAIASFFETCDVVTSGEGGAISPMELLKDTKLFSEGKINDNLLLPTRHLAEISMGDMVVFRRGGVSPVAHIFETTSYPRYSNVERLHTANLGEK